MRVRTRGPSGATVAERRQDRLLHGKTCVESAPSGFDGICRRFSHLHGNALRATGGTPQDSFDTEGDDSPHQKERNGPMPPDGALPEQETEERSHEDPQVVISNRRLQLARRPKAYTRKFRRENYPGHAVSGGVRLGGALKKTTFSHTFALPKSPRTFRPFFNGLTTHWRETGESTRGDKQLTQKPTNTPRTPSEPHNFTRCFWSRTRRNALPKRLSRPQPQTSSLKVP
ncbi:hypothetical protein TvY486_0042900 [Trypanosoma vivax Y486]|uniref:Uncharacterized protein n=1 Tax=Trypanosoma vivax (strain Y486) TaxID=1055687 RepID=F9WUY5_TRYVY|nr:hypothetical protein TvY486_0042900 [Trypanosoma vivax Y486]|eukprot:CCD21385.1 hypothetical protein TvY486_0042900 [Trypanosoma vivax Y486]